MSQPTAFVTGAGRRFGFELAKSLLTEGYRVVPHYNTSKAGVSELEHAGAIAVHADFSDLNQVQTVGRELAVQLKREDAALDLLVNNASCFFNNAKVDEDLANLQAVMNVHTVAPYLLIKELADALAKNKGCVVNITDIYTDSPSTDYLAYCAAKAGLANLTQGFAKQLAPRVRVNAIQPGPILFLPEHGSAHRQQVLSETPLELEGGLEPMIQTVRYLRDNPFITGESIKVDGGRALLI